MNTSRRLKLRSRTGCDRCRSRHQKCDELQPQCSRCFDADIPCAYGKYELRRHHMADSVFVLSLPPARHTFRLFPSLSSSHSLFLSYYVHEASAAISCNEGIQYDTCNAVISAGSTFPSLLYASLLFSAMHKSSRMHDASRSIKDQSIQIQVLQLRSAALSCLRSEVCQRITPNNEAIIATMLMLATCELRYYPETSAWRQHFEYARYLLSQFPAQYRPGDEALWRFILRRITVIGFLLSLPTSWPRLPRMCYLSTYPAILPCLQTVGIIDGTMACCMELLDVFRWIGILEEMKYQSLELPKSEPQNITEYSQQISAKLVSFVQQMMARDSKTPPMVSNELQGLPTDTHLEDYRICNTIAQHVSLICLYRYGLGLDRKDPSVTNSVRSVIELASSIPMHAGSHPSICLSTALFIAGHEAEREYEGDIKNLLKIQYRITKSQNTQKALDMLHRTWSAVPSPHDTSKKDRSLTASSIDDFVPY